MAPAQINSVNKWMAWIGWFTALVMFLKMCGGDTVNAVTFYNDTKNSIVETKQLSKKVDSIFIFMHDLTRDFKEFKDSHEKYDAKQNQADINLNDKTIQLNRERGQ